MSLKPYLPMTCIGKPAFWTRCGDVHMKGRKCGYVPILGLIVPMLGLIACTPVQTKPSKPIERVVYVPVPAELTAPLPVYERQAETFGEAWQQAEHNTLTLGRCNADRAAVAAIQGSQRDR